MRNPPPKHVTDAGSHVTLSRRAPPRPSYKQLRHGAGVLKGPRRFPEVPKPPPGHSASAAVTGTAPLLSNSEGGGGHGKGWG